MLLNLAGGSNNSLFLPQVVYQAGNQTFECRTLPGVGRTKALTQQDTELFHGIPMMCLPDRGEIRCQSPPCTCRAQVVCSLLIHVRIGPITAEAPLFILHQRLRSYECHQALNTCPKYEPPC